MKQSKGFSQFLGEEKKKKSTSKKKTSSKKDSRKEKDGADDQRYIALMDEYKRMRGKNRGEANEIHHKALELKANGDVSKRAIVAGQHI
tara:strand:- start:507 stop:773 length:267 start_codon:yes stop_codon:yes gene_type:complete